MGVRFRIGRNSISDRIRRNSNIVRQTISPGASSKQRYAPSTNKKLDKHRITELTGRMRRC